MTKVLLCDLSLGQGQKLHSRLFQVNTMVPKPRPSLMEAGKKSFHRWATMKHMPQAALSCSQSVTPSTAPRLQAKTWFSSWDLLSFTTIQLSQNTLNLFYY